VLVVPQSLIVRNVLRESDPVAFETTRQAVTGSQLQAISQ